MKVRKARIAPMVFLLLLVMGFVICLGLYCIAVRAVASFEQECGSFDGTLEKTSRIIEQNIVSNGRTVAAYAELLRIEPEDKREAIRQMETLYRHSQFGLLALVDRSGKVWNQQGITFMLEEDNEIITLLKQEKQESFILRGGLRDSLVAYGAPVFSGEEWIGYLVGTVNGKINLKSFGEEMPEESGLLYILNEEDQVIAYSGGEGTAFDYRALSKDRFYTAGGEKERKEMEPAGLGAVLSRFRSLLQNDSLCWYEKSIAVGENVQWKVVAGRPARFSEGIVNEVLMISLLFFILVLVFLFLLLIFIISQSIANRKLIKMAYWDEVVSWHNWSKFGLDAKKLLRNRRQKYAFVAFDIGRFRLINDIYGQKGGDQVLSSVANILKKNTDGRREAFAREYMDVFMLLLQYKTKEELTERLLGLNEALIHCTELCSLHLSFGVYLIPDDYQTMEKMEIYASMTRDVVKKGQAEVIAFFDEKLRLAMVKEQEIENRMEEALEHEEFKIYLQPKYSADGNRIEGAEALVRWIGPDCGFLSPDEFIPIFEKNRFIIKLDNYMLKQTAALQKKWMEEGRELVTISVNISRIHLSEADLVSDIESIVEPFALPEGAIEIELTESAFFDDKKVLVNTIKEMQDRGFKVSMDDFGAGYSSLNSLKDLPLDVVKLDGEFFRFMEDNERSRIVIQDTVAMAKHLDMKIVAEGIETREQVEFLESIGCDLIQGYYFAKPMPVKEYEALLYEIKE